MAGFIPAIQTHKKDTPNPPSRRSRKALLRAFPLLGAFA
jgi:hypothetical protein